ncbi:ABC transporter ATP-binding protein [Nesterenkonia populi]|uniref:ABC transporter ATP-binding protein n=1 Tax=Nesterenkonia populi TaxID=1591087 RepID=UPI0011BFABDB|nr:ABC transporter ATP-binding protein [Nesterenkonia populi]
MSATAVEQSILEIDDVSYAYKPSLPSVMEHVSLALREGEFFVLLGPSGCGKTTILNQVAGFELPSAGEIRLQGKPISAPGPDRSVVFQGHDSLLGWLTVRQNVDFPLKVAGLAPGKRKEQVKRALTLVELEKQADKYPHELSGGMKQRVQIARGLATDAPTVLMDEPFGALDAQTRATLQHELSDIWSRERRTILFITHDIAEAVILADRVGVMSAGPAAYLHSVMEIGLERPRQRTSEFTERVNELEARVTAAKARQPFGVPNERAAA